MGPRRRSAVAALGVLLGYVVAGCGTSGSAAPRTEPVTPPTATPSSPSAQPSSPSTPSPSSASSPSSPTGPPSTGVSKLLVFVVENHSLDEMRSQMPWTYALAHRFGYATAYRAMTHPSLPNYLAIAGGSTFGLQDDHDPSAHPLSGPSVFGEGALAPTHRPGVRRRHAVTLLHDLDRPVRRPPQPVDLLRRRAHVLPDSTPRSTASRGDVAAGDLPDAGMVVPDICHDAHDCSLATADAWLRQEVGLAMSGPDYLAGRLAVVVTADEDDGSQSNTVLTVVAHPSLHGVVVSSPLSQLSLSRLYTEVLGVPPLREAASAPSMAAAFHLPLAHP